MSGQPWRKTTGTPSGSPPSDHWRVRPSRSVVRGTSASGGTRRRCGAAPPSCPPSIRHSWAPSVAPSTSRTNARNRWPPMTDHRVSRSITRDQHDQAGLGVGGPGEADRGALGEPHPLEGDLAVGHREVEVLGHRCVEGLSARSSPSNHCACLHLEDGAVAADELAGAVAPGEESDHVLDAHGARGGAADAHSARVVSAVKVDRSAGQLTWLCRLPSAAGSDVGERDRLQPDAGAWRPRGVRPAGSRASSRAAWSTSCGVGARAAGRAAPRG